MLHRYICSAESEAMAADKQRPHAAGARGAGGGSPSVDTPDAGAAAQEDEQLQRALMLSMADVGATARPQDQG